MSFLASLAAPFSFLVYLSTSLSLALLFAFLLLYLIIRVPPLCSSMCIVLLNVTPYRTRSCRLRMFRYLLSPLMIAPPRILMRESRISDFSLKFSARYPGLARAICVSLLQNREIFALLFRRIIPYIADNRSKSTYSHARSSITIAGKIGRSCNRLRLHMHISHARLYV